MDRESRFQVNSKIQKIKLTYLKYMEIYALASNTSGQPAQKEMMT